MPSSASRILAATAAVLLLSAPVRAGEPAAEARHADIRKLMVLTGAGELGVQTAHQMLQALRPMVPEAPESFWQELAARIRPDDLVDMVVPIYAKHLDAKDVKDLIAFFESPAGRKLTKAQPAILQESMAAGQVWGRRIAEDIVRQAQARGLKIREL
jgi:uncharacterized protein